MPDLRDKNIVIGVSGCIAAYKAAELIRLFIRAGANVEVIMTESAKEFITPLTLSTLSRNKVHTGMFDNSYEYSINHVSLAAKADVFLIAPATANVIGKIASGIADDLLTTSVMATKAPVVLAPAMNMNMWDNCIVQENVKKLIQKGYTFIEPDSGDLACGYKGTGRLQDIDVIFDRVCKLLQPDLLLKGKQVLVTIGGTREYIDPVRFITNKSSGKMGLAIAKESARLGASVMAVSTLGIDIPGVKTINVETALEMKSAVESLFASSDVLIMAAAVADYTVKNYSDKKMKKNSESVEMTLNLVKNPDIVAEIAKIKRKNQLVIGFAAETDNLLENARQKLLSKGLDLIVANDVSGKDTGMGSDYNEVTFIYPDGNFEQLPRTTKSKVALRLVEIIITFL